MLEQGVAGPEAVRRHPAVAQPVLARAGLENYKPLRVRGLVASRWISFNVVALGLLVAFSVWHVAVLGDEDASLSAILASQDRLAVVYIANMVVYLLGAVIFLFWFARAVRNLDALGAAGPRYGWKMAVGGWFIPIAALFIPKQVANDAWRGSDPDTVDRPPQADRGDLPLFLNLWWLFWVLGMLVWWASWRMPVDTLDQERSVTIVEAVASGLDLVCGVLAILLIRRLTQRQEERAERLRTL